MPGEKSTEKVNWLFCRLVILKTEPREFGENMSSLVIFFRQKESQIARAYKIESSRPISVEHFKWAFFKENSNSKSVIHGFDTETEGQRLFLYFERLFF